MRHNVNYINSVLWLFTRQVFFVDKVDKICRSLIGRNVEVCTCTCFSSLGYLKHNVNDSVLIKFSQKTSVFTLIITSSP